MDENVSRLDADTTGQPGPVICDSAFSSFTTVLVDDDLEEMLTLETKVLNWEI